METGIELIAAERERQIEKEKWSLEHDDHHTGEELAFAAVSYALPDRLGPFKEEFWKFEKSWFKPNTNSSNTNARIKELVKAGALIAAEIDRLQRTVKSDNTLEKYENRFGETVYNTDD